MISGTPLGRPVVLGRRAAVSSGHWLASQAGIEALKSGGNAVDAAVAMLSSLAVLKPDACGLGSDCFLQIFDAKSGTVHALNASGPAPALADANAYAGGIPMRGPLASAVPGAVGGWEAVLERFGTMKLPKALSAAIGYARYGIPVSLHLASALEGGREMLLADRGSAAALFPDGRSLKYGELLHQPQLADTLDTIARGGAAAFYKGDFARAVDADARERGGLLRYDDLAGYKPVWREPLCISYRGYDVYEQPPVSQGVIMLEAAKIVEGFPLVEYGDRSAEFVHLHTEAVKLAFADRLAHMGDPDVVENNAARLLDEAFIAARRRAIRIDRASDIPPAARLLQTASDTSYGCVVDEAGNGVSFIQSVFALWGAAYLVPGTGAVMNNRMTGFSLDPESPNFLQPRKRTMHTLNTVVVCKEGKLRYLFGTPGADAQVQSNTQALTRILDFGLNPQLTVEAPRCYWERRLGTLVVESPFGPEVLANLEARGHRVADGGVWNSVTGGMEMIHLNEHGVREAAADPRREGYALAY